MNKKKFIYIGIIFFAFLIGNFWDLPPRYILSSFYQDEYGRHVQNCDSAMREHFVMKSQLSKKPTSKNVDSLHSSEVALIDCHEYDKFRKKLLRLGLSVDDLGAMGLLAIERKKADLHILVKEHEIRY